MEGWRERWVSGWRREGIEWRDGRMDYVMEEMDGWRNAVREEVDGGMDVVMEEVDGGRDAVVEEEGSPAGRERERAGWRGGELIATVKKPAEEDRP